ncbi:hypothetical protein Pth03_78470 [Planotetraspora thailandica]|uniref:Asp23/Gls24 family envelope stress response protein n=1 Tax=Planotetraspora thailandica TaxID=487172 RepID=A0A8J4DF20_9ACTN|nr:Asp23/Gls24 family envelope stress response protein [Planotetraspora thailandica]GII59458.1 hypothetical protein Pth03_78470 [Planotetraspora thailandica]
MTHTRGHVEVSERAFSKIATEVAAENRRIAGRPEVHASIAGGVAAVRCRLSLHYPAPVRQATAEIRHHVRERVRELTGISVGSVDIDVVGLVPPEEGP